MSQNIESELHYYSLLYLATLMLVQLYVYNLFDMDVVRAACEMSMI